MRIQQPEFCDDFCLGICLLYYTEDLDIVFDMFSSGNPVSGFCYIAGVPDSRISSKQQPIPCSHSMHPIAENLSRGYWDPRPIQSSDGLHRKGMNIFMAAPKRRKRIEKAMHYRFSENLFLFIFRIHRFMYPCLSIQSSQITEDYLLYLPTDPIVHSGPFFFLRSLLGF